MESRSLGLGSVFFEFASVNFNAMLNHLGEKEDRGKISGFRLGRQLHRRHRLTHPLH